MQQCFAVHYGIVTHEGIACISWATPWEGYTFAHREL